MPSTSPWASDANTVPGPVTQSVPEAPSDLDGRRPVLDRAPLARPEHRVAPQAGGSGVPRRGFKPFPSLINGDLGKLRASLDLSFL